jgi:hypothetical protein
MSKPPKRPRDPNQLAKLITDIATGEVEESQEHVLTPAERGRMGGLKGGAKRAEGMTPQERSQIAKKAATARWSQ